MKSIDFSTLLQELIQTGNTDAMQAGVKALKAHKKASDYSLGEWEALAVIKSHGRTTAGRNAAKLLAHRPHSFVADW